MLIWKIAWRNLLRHRGKSLVIGGILFLGAFFMTVGDAVIQGAKKGVEDNLVQRFSGHLVLAAANEQSHALFFGPPNARKIIPDYPSVKEILEQQEFIERFLPMTRGDALILNEDGKAGSSLFLGVNFEDYQQIFLENVELVEGSLLKNGERGVLISDQIREDIYENQKFWIVPEGGTLDPASLTADAQKANDQGTLQIRSDLVLMGFSTISFENDIRLPVKGVFRFRSLNTILAGMNFMDIESYRECFGYITAAENAGTRISAEQEAVLAKESVDDFFTDAEVVTPVEMKVDGYDLQTMQQHTQRMETPVNSDQGAYNIVAIKLKPGITIPDAQERLERVLTDAKAQVKTITWEQALREIVQFSSLTQGALFVFVLFIFFVAIIVIMNTLSMAAIERTGEIGMMRAVGARKSFVSRMFFAETSLLSAMFGGAGILAGILTALGLGLLRISMTGNEILSLLFGGDAFHPVIGGRGIAVGIVELAIVTLLAMCYPILIARKITPLEAIARD